MFVSNVTKYTSVGAQNHVPKPNKAETSPTWQHYFPIAANADAPRVGLYHCEEARDCTILSSGVSNTSLLIPFKLWSTN